MKKLFLMLAAGFMAVSANAQNTARWCYYHSDKADS